MLVGALGTLAAAGPAGSLLALTGDGRIDEAATATKQAVRLNPPDPVGGWLPGALYIALYGHPGSSTLGVLGEQGVEEAVARVRQVAGAYASFGRPVVPTFEIIATGWRPRLPVPTVTTRTSSPTPGSSPGSIRREPAASM